MARTKGRYVLETIQTDGFIPVDSNAAWKPAEKAMKRIWLKWWEMGCPAGEFLIEFATREGKDDE